MPTTLDPETLDRVLRLGGVDLLRRLIQVAGENIENRLDSLRQALAARPPDFAAAEHAAHSLKSSSAYVGALNLADLAASLEKRAAHGAPDGDDPDAVAASLAADAEVFASHLPGLLAALDAFADGVGDP